MTLSIGGDDITEFLYVLLDRICFPYRDLDLARSYDWNVMEDLKARLCTLGEVRISNCFLHYIYLYVTVRHLDRVMLRSTCMTS